MSNTDTSQEAVSSKSKPSRMAQSAAAPLLVSNLGWSGEEAKEKFGPAWPLFEEPGTLRAWRRMTAYKRGDVILVKFPYSDLVSYKRRPALIVRRDRRNRVEPEGGDSNNLQSGPHRRHPSAGQERQSRWPGYGDSFGFRHRCRSSGHRPSQGNRQSDRPLHLHA